MRGTTARLESLSGLRTRSSDFEMRERRERKIYYRPTRDCYRDSESEIELIILTLLEGANFEIAQVICSISKLAPFQVVNVSDFD